jgi:hypothetical protein
LDGFLFPLAPTIRGDSRGARRELLSGLAILLAGAEVLVQGIGHNTWRMGMGMVMVMVMVMVMGMGMVMMQTTDGR